MYISIKHAYCFLRSTQNPYPKRHLDRFSRFCTSHGIRSIYFTMSCPFPPQHCSCASGIGIPSNTCYLGPTPLIILKNIFIGSAVFAQITAESPCSLQRARPFPPKIQNCPFAWEIWTLSNTWFIGPTRFHNPNGISIGSATFAGHMTVTDRQSDHSTLVTIPYIIIFLLLLLLKMY